MRKARQIAILGMVVSGLLAVMKIMAGWRGHSASVVADGFESAADVVASGLVLIGLILAARPADENHPYGHGRVETLTGLLLGFFLFAPEPSSHGTDSRGWGRARPLILDHDPARRLHLRQSRARLREVPSRQDHWEFVAYSRCRQRRHRYPLRTVALGALSLTLWRPVEFARADHYGAFAVGIIVIVTALRVMQQSSLHLMDTMPDDDAMADVRRVAMSVGVKGVEKCFARKTGLQYHVDLHLEVDPHITVRSSHEIAQRVREKIRDEIPWVADVLVHVEPYEGLPSRRT